MSTLSVIYVSYIRKWAIGVTPCDISQWICWEDLSRNANSLVVMPYYVGITCIISNYTLYTTHYNYLGAYYCCMHRTTNGTNTTVTIYWYNTRGDNKSKNMNLTQDDKVRPGDLEEWTPPVSHAAHADNSSSQIRL